MSNDDDDDEKIKLKFIQERVSLYEIRYDRQKMCGMKRAFYQV